MTLTDNSSTLYNGSSVTMTTPRCSHGTSNMLSKDRPLFLEIGLPDVWYDGQSDNTTNRTTVGRDEALAKVEILVQSIILGLAVTGNSCVLTALARRGKAGSRMHLFIFHLSIADLLVALFNILPQLIWEITETFYGGDALCRYIKFMQIYVMYLSTYMLVMTAIDRYRAVCHPLSAFNTSSKTTIYVMIWAAYVLSGILSLPQPIIFKFQESETGVWDCWVNFNPPWTMNLYIISFTFAIYIVPLIILIFAYISICRTIWKKHRIARLETLIMSSSTAGSDVSLASRNIYSSYMANKVVYRNGGVIERRPNVFRRNRLPTSTIPRVHSLRGFSRAKMKTVKLTFVVIVAYLLCWSPFFISHLWWMYDEGQEHSHAGVSGNERADALSDNATIENVSSMDKSDIIYALRENIRSEDFKEEDKGYSLSRLRKLCIPIVATRRENHKRNPSRYINQHKTGVVSLNTLRYILGRRSEQL